jgi:hypothetical protein
VRNLSSGEVIKQVQLEKFGNGFLYNTIVPENQLSQIDLFKPPYPGLFSPPYPISPSPSPSNSSSSPSPSLQPTPSTEPSSTPNLATQFVLAPIAAIIVVMTITTFILRKRHKANSASSITN